MTTKRDDGPIFFTFDTDSVDPRPTKYPLSVDDLRKVQEYAERLHRPFIPGDIMDRFGLRLNVAVAVIDELKNSGSLRRLDSQEKQSTGYHISADVYSVRKRA